MTLNFAEPKVRIRDRRAVRNELEKVRVENEEGLLVAEEVVTEASNLESPLHDYFDWQDTEAAHKWRLSQARGLIRHVELIWNDGDKEVPVPHYVSVESDRKRVGGGYRDTRDVLSSKKLLAELEETAKRDIDGVLKRYEMLKELCASVRKAARIQPKKKKSI